MLSKNVVRSVVMGAIGLASLVGIAIFAHLGKEMTTTVSLMSSLWMLGIHLVIQMWHGLGLRYYRVLAYRARTYVTVQTILVLACPGIIVWMLVYEWWGAAVGLFAASFVSLLHIHTAARLRRIESVSTTRSFIA